MLYNIKKRNVFELGLLLDQDLGPYSELGFGSNLDLAWQFKLDLT